MLFDIILTFVLFLPIIFLSIWLIRIVIQDRNERKRKVKMVKPRIKGSRW